MNNMKPESSHKRQSFQNYASYLADAVERGQIEPSMLDKYWNTKALGKSNSTMPANQGLALQELHLRKSRYQ